MKKENKGFTLIEVLAVIFIISLLFGVSFYYVNNVINSSKEKAKSLTETSIKRSASLYVQEYADEVVWTENGAGVKNACVDVSQLKDKGYIKDKQMKDISSNGSIKLSKKNGTIFVDEYDEEKNCNGNSVVPIPTSKVYCSNLTYKGSNLSLVDLKNIPEEIRNKVELENNSRMDAGSYDVKVILKKKEDVWSDGTRDTKTITCTIKKDVPNLRLNPSGQTSSGTVGTSATVSEVTSNVSGSLSVRSSNTNYVVGSTTSGTIAKNGTTNLSARYLATNDKVTKYLYVTLTPTGDDAKNYYTTTKVYTIGTVGLQKVKVPECKNSLSFKVGVKQELIDSPNKKAYTLTGNTIASEPGVYSVHAFLKYGYSWDDGDDDEKFNYKTIICKILQPSTLKIIDVKEIGDDSNVFDGDVNSGSLLKTKSMRITFKSNVKGSIKEGISLETGKYIDVKDISSDSSGTLHYATVTGINVVDELQLINFTLTPTEDGYGQSTTQYHLKIRPNEFLLNYFYRTSYLYSNSSTFNTRHAINWGRDANISFNFTLPSGGRNTEYMLLGTYNNKDNSFAQNQLLLKINKKGQLVINIGENNTWTTTNQNILKLYGTMLSLSFNWNSNGKNFSVVIKNGKEEVIKKQESLSSSPSGFSSSISFGNNRGDGSNYGDIKIENIMIGSSREAGSKIGTIPGINSSNGLSFFRKSFLGWNSVYNGTGEYLTADYVMPAHAVNWYALWGDAVYYIKYELNSKYASPGKYAPTVAGKDYQITISNPTTSRRGYVFTGWTGRDLSDDAIGLNPNTNIFERWNGSAKLKRTIFKSLGDAGHTITMSANWGKATLTLTYDSNKGIACNPNTKQATYDSAWGKLCKPHRDNYIFLGWYTAKTGGEEVTKDSIAERNLTVYARWKPGHSVHIKLDMNGGTLDSSSFPEIYSSGNYVISSDSAKENYIDVPYGEKVTLYSINDKNYINIQRVGFHATKGSEMFMEGNNKIFAQNVEYSSDDFCPAKDADCTVTLKVNWCSNNVYIKLNVNGGTLNETTNYKEKTSAGNVKNGSSDIFYTIPYGGALTKLASYNTANYINITRVNYFTNSGEEWILDGSDKTFAQGECYYAASEFCNATYNDCTAVLKVNWITKNVNIKFNVNGGVLKSTSNYSYGTTLYGNIKKNEAGDTTLQTVPYGGTLTKLASYNTQNFINVTRIGYYVDVGKEWFLFRRPNKTFAQGTYNYAASEFCDASEGDCDAYLMVNWKPKKLTVNFHCNDGRNPHVYSQDFFYDDWYNYFNSGCYYSGHRFYKWYENSSLNSSNYYTYASPVTNNWINTKVGNNKSRTIDLYAKWNQNTTTTTTTTDNRRITIKYDANGTNLTKSGYQLDKYGYLTGGDLVTSLRPGQTLKIYHPEKYLTSNNSYAKIDPARAWFISGLPSTRWLSTPASTNMGENYNFEFLASSACDFSKGDSCTIILCAFWTDNNQIMIGSSVEGNNVHVSVYSPKGMDGSILDYINYRISEVHVGASGKNFNDTIYAYNGAIPFGVYSDESRVTEYENYLKDSIYTGNTKNCAYGNLNYYHCVEDGTHKNDNPVGFNAQHQGVNAFYHTFDKNDLFAKVKGTTTFAVCVRLPGGKSYCGIFNSSNHPMEYKYINYR